jgi:hypothetical protein
VDEGEAEVYLAAPPFLAVCRALLALADGAPRPYRFDSALRAGVERARAAVEAVSGVTTPLAS